MSAAASLMPSQWNRMPLRRLASGPITNGLGAPAEDFAEGSVRYVRTTDIKDLFHLDDAKMAGVPADIGRSALVQRGDILMTAAGSIGKSHFYDSDEEACYAGFLVRFRPAQRLMNARYAAWWTASRDFVSQVESGAVRSTIDNFSAGKYRAIKAPVPPVDVQAEIADFLDRETAKIDAVIEKQRALIAKLRLRRSSALLRAVSGADRDGEKVPSGTSWLGAIPSYWQVGNIRRFAIMKTGHTPSRGVPEYWQDTCIPWITLADVWQLRGGQTTYIQDTSEKISELGLQNSAAELLPAGTVVLSRTASIGFSGIMPVPMATSQDYWNWVCGPLLMPEFLLYVFRAMHDEFRALSAGSTHKTIYQGDAASFRIPVPPLAEQREIAAHMDRETARIDALIARSERLIELSQERRSALITAAVTGQIDTTATTDTLEGAA